MQLERAILSPRPAERSDVKLPTPGSAAASGKRPRYAIPRCDWYLGDARDGADEEMPHIEKCDTKDHNAVICDVMRAAILHATGTT